MVGIDIEDISRFQDKPEEFYNRLFTDEEIKYCKSNKNPAPHFAARFCAKEAVFKALSTCDINIPSYKSIEILKKESGAVYVNLPQNINKTIHISISHEKDKAIAIAFVEK